jgi:nitrogen fixation protein FixH
MKRELKGRHVLLVLLGFFGVTIGVNAAMATYAITTFSGEDISDPYVNGLAYNKTLAARSAQTKLRWTATIDATRATTVTNVAVVVHDHEHQDVRGLKVSITFRRPTNAKLDRTEALNAASDGTYAASLTGVAPGAWDLIVSTAAADGTRFEATRRVVLQ